MQAPTSGRILWQSTLWPSCSGLQKACKTAHSLVTCTSSIVCLVNGTLVAKGAGRALRYASMSSAQKLLWSAAISDLCTFGPHTRGECERDQVVMRPMK
eukprot:998923-Amphidinium_carterae.1